MTLFFAERAGLNLTLDFFLEELDGGLTKYAGNPVLPKGAGGEWDDWLVREHSPVRDEAGLIVTEADGIWGYYWGMNQAEPGATFQIGLAKSVDGGTTWPIREGVVIAPGGAAWYNTDVCQPTVTKLDDGSFVMLAAGLNGAVTTGSIGCFSSADGLTWVDEGQKLTLGQFLDGATAITEMGVPSMIRRSDDLWIMLFEGLKSGVTNGWRVFGASASDPTGTWTVMNSGQPLFSPTGVGWESVGVANPHLIEITPGQFAFTYNGIDGSLTWKIGFAYGTDLTAMTRYSGNPILSPGTAGQWDDRHTESCFLFKEPGATSVRILYNGFSNVDGSAQIGLATT